MRLLIIIFTLLPQLLFAQRDSLLFRYVELESELTINQKNDFGTLLAGKQVAALQITANISNQSEISSNRVLAEKRLFEVKRFCLASGVAENKISIIRRLVSEGDLLNTIAVEIEFVPPKTGRVIYKTATVEILDTTGKKTDIKPIVRPIKTKKRSAKKQKEAIRINAAPAVKDYGKLNIEDFKQGNKVIIPDLLFVATRHQLRPVSYRSLYHLLQIMRDRPTMIVELQGHICCKSDGEDGMDFDTNLPNLSEARAKEVFDYLVRNGISPNRMTYRGFGSKYKRVEDNGNAIEGLLNRRVEVYIIRE